ncbi:hypothetical protein FOA52_005097 [Chlamydomonas sp. UWO 241]|nr:hypothetical protein FOA52_005097 [Chlamydomonas sp. UWO 241]
MYSIRGPTAGVMITHCNARVCVARRAQCVRVRVTQQAGDASTSAPSSHVQEVYAPAPERLNDYKHAVSMEDFRTLGHEVVDWIADYYGRLEGLRVKPDVQPGYLAGKLPGAAPEEPEPWADVMSDFEDKIMPGVVHWQHPRFFAYFNANASAPGLLADMLMGALNMIGFSWAASPASTELEIVAMDWLAKLVGLPARFLHSSSGTGGGVIQGTTSEAVVVALLAARARTMEGRPAADKLRLVAYGSDQAHSCCQKACMVVGIDHVRVLPARADNGWALDPQDLARAMDADAAAGLLPCFALGTIGTTSSCAVDPIGAMGDECGRRSVWLHVDAAYAGSAAVAPEMREQYFGGLDAVDSYSFNPHKWLLTNFDCCAMWVADTGPLKAALSLTPVFLRGTGNALDFKDWQLPLGRRFRALKLWMVLRMYGGKSLRAYVRHHIALAQYFSNQVLADPRFEIAAPTRFGLVCFRLKDTPPATNRALLEAINAGGDMFLIHTELGGRHTIRMAIGSTGTQLVHVQQAWLGIQAAATRVLDAASSSKEGEN